MAGPENMIGVGRSWSWPEHNIKERQGHPPKWVRVNGSLVCSECSLWKVSRTPALKLCMLRVVACGSQPGAVGWKKADMLVYLRSTTDRLARIFFCFFKCHSSPCIIIIVIIIIIIAEA